MKLCEHVYLYEVIVFTKFHENWEWLGKNCEFFTRGKFLKVAPFFDPDFKFIILKGGSDGEKRRIKDLENRLVNAEAANNSLQRKNVALAEAKSVLERDLDDRELQINAHQKVKKIMVMLSNATVISLL